MRLKASTGGNLLNVLPQLEVAFTKKEANGQLIVGHSSEVASTSMIPQIMAISISTSTVAPPSRSSKKPSPSASVRPEPAIISRLSKLIVRSSPIHS